MDASLEDGHAPRAPPYIQTALSRAGLQLREAPGKRFGVFASKAFAAGSHSITEDAAACSVIRHSQPREHHRQLSHCSSRVRALPLRRQAPDELLGVQRRALLLQRPSSRSLATAQAVVCSFEKDAEGAAGRRPLEAALQHHVHVCRAFGLQRRPVLCLSPRCLQPPYEIRHHVPLRRTSFTCCDSRDVDSVPDDRQGCACM